MIRSVPPPWHRPTRKGQAIHTCGWARKDGVWTCIQEFYVGGIQPETGCGKVWP